MIHSFPKNIQRLQKIRNWTARYDWLFQHHDDIQDGLEKDRYNYLFTDIQARGAYPVCALKRIESEEITDFFADGDAETLMKGTVDFVAFSYYCSRCTIADPEIWVC